MINIKNTIKNRFQLEAINLAILVFIFIASSGMLTRTEFLPYAWLLIYAYTAITFFLYADELLNTAKSSWIIFLLPFLVVITTLWSLDQNRTIIASAQFLYTCYIGLWIGTLFTPKKIFFSLFYAMGIGVSLSVFNAYIFEFLEPAYKVDDYIGAEKYLVGIYEQKNVFGNSLFLLALSSMVVGAERKKIAAFLFILLILIAPLIETKSTSSLVIYLLSLSLPVIFFILIRKRLSIFLSLFAVASLCIAAIFALLNDFHITENLIDKLGKDTTLTGRTQLWQLAIEVFMENPLLGIGYEAYWQPGIYDASRLFKAPDGSIITGFHNVFLEVMVATGIAGLFLILLKLTLIFGRAIKWWLLSKDIYALGSIYLLLTMYLLSVFDNIIFRQHEIFYILLISIYTIANHETISKLQHKD